MSGAKAKSLYQVDFMAALFSGLLLIWLSGIATSENVVEDTPENYDIAVWGTLEWPAGSNFSISLLPAAALNAPCISAAVLVRLRFQEAQPCQTDQQFAGLRRTQSYDEVITATTPAVAALVRSRNYTFAQGAPVDFIFSDGRSAAPHILGLAFASGRTSKPTYIAIGYLPAKLVDKGMLRVKAGIGESVNALVGLPKNATFSNVDAYQFETEPKFIRLGGQVAHKFSLQLRILRNGHQDCYTTMEMMVDQNNPSIITGLKKC